VRAGGSAHGSWSRIAADPVRVAPQPRRCDPYRVEMCVGERTVGDAPGSHMLPLQGTDHVSGTFLRRTQFISIYNSPTGGNAAVVAGNNGGVPWNIALVVAKSGPR